MQPSESMRPPCSPSDFVGLSGADRRNGYRRTMGGWLLVLALALCLSACQDVAKPELKGKGPLAIVIPRGTSTSESHAPIEKWRVDHKRAIQEGDFSQKECVLCHNPDTGCNRCHGYVGAKGIQIPEARLYYGEKGEMK